MNYFIWPEGEIELVLSLQQQFIILMSIPSQRLFLVTYYLSVSKVFDTSMWGQLSCHGRKYLQTIFTIEIIFKILAASSCMIDFFCKSMATSNFCDDEKST